MDDIILVSSSESLLTEVKDNLKSKFHMKDLGALSWFLGINFGFSEDTITMDQRKYIECSCKVQHVRL